MQGHSMVKVAAVLTQVTSVLGLHVTLTAIVQLSGSTCIFTSYFILPDQPLMSVLALGCRLL